MKHIQLLRLQNERSRRLLDTLTRAHLPGSKHYCPEALVALLDWIEMREHEIERLQNP